MADFLALPGQSKVIVSCAVVFIPVFFAGVIFATAFRSSKQPDVDFGSNIGGIILGGLSEYLSLVLGFNHLLWVAIGYYLLSAILSRNGIGGGRITRVRDPIRDDKTRIACLGIEAIGRRTGRPWHTARPASSHRLNSKLPTFIDAARSSTENEIGSRDKPSRGSAGV